MTLVGPNVIRKPSNRYRSYFLLTWNHTVVGVLSIIPCHIHNKWYFSPPSIFARGSGATTSRAGFRELSLISNQYNKQKRVVVDNPSVDGRLTIFSISFGRLSIKHMVDFLLVNGWPIISSHILRATVDQQHRRLLSGNGRSTIFHR